MTKKTKVALTFLIVFLVIFFALSAFVFWILKTPEGSLRTLEILGNQSGAKINIGKSEGNFLEGLILRDVKLNLVNFDIQIKYIYVEASPGSFLTDLWIIKKLHLEDAVLFDRRPEEKKSPDFSWPEAGGLLAALGGKIKGLDIKHLEYRKNGNPPIQINRIQGRLAWTAGTLTLKDIRMDTSRARIQGTFSAGLKKPSLFVDAAIKLHPPETAGMKDLFIKADLGKSSLPEQIAGRTSFTAVATDGKRTELDGTLGLTKQSIRFRELHLQRSGLKGIIKANGEVSFPDGSPFYKLRSTVSHLDLSSEIRFKTDISGTAEFSGSPSDYTGRFSLSNAGETWKSAAMTGSLAGNSRKLSLALSQATWLKGNIAGAFEMNFEKDTSLRGSLRATRLDPGKLFPEWEGMLNVTARGEFHWKSDTPPAGHVDIRLLQSRLRGKGLTGKSDILLHEGDVVIKALDIHHQDFDARASGSLKNRIDYSAVVNNLGGIMPDARGRLSAEGWVSLRDDLTAFSAKGTGRDVSAGEISVGALSYSVALGTGKDRLLSAHANARNLQYKTLKLDTAFAQSKGTLLRHTITAGVKSSQAQADIFLSGSYHSGTWQGTVDKMSGKDRFGPWQLHKPTGLTVSRKMIAVAPAILSANNERLDFEMDLSLQPLQGYLNTSWNDIHFERIAQWFVPADNNISGNTSGTLTAHFAKGNMTSLSGNIKASGRTIIAKKTVAFDGIDSVFNWDDKGLSALTALSLGAGGSIKGQISSPSPVGFALPERGRIDVNALNVDLQLFEGFYPDDVKVSGRITGNVGGQWLPGSAFDLSGHVDVISGAISRQHPSGRIHAEIRNAAADFSWRKEALSGNINIAFIDQGKMQASFKIPMPAKYPASIDPSGPISASIRGRLQETGLINAVFPGLLEESKGMIDLDVSAGGTWKNPKMEGRVDMTGAVAYLPAAGIRLQNISIKAYMKDQKIVIDSFNVSSGPGKITLQAVIALQDWRILNYSGTMKGSDFQTLDLPEIRILTSPDIRFEGNIKKVTIRGDVVVPKALILGGQGPSQVKPSRDIVMIDAPPSEDKKLPIDLDVQVSFVLGNDVRARLQGANLRLVGKVALTATDLENMTAKGLIQIAEGSYNAYGVNLNIEKGRIVFDGPVDSPQIDVTAVRKLEDVTAGILIIGTLPSPAIRLYSLPSMPDPEILAYLVMGQPLKGNEQDLSILVRAAGSMLSKSESESVVSQLLRRTGLADVDITFSQGESPAQGQTGLNGSAQSGLSTADQTGPTGAMVSIGKYLTPRLYVSFGRYLFSDANVVRLRYKFSENWELETHGGTISGADLYYKIEFH